MIKTSFSVDSTQAKKRLRAVMDGVKDFKKPLREIEDYELDEIKKQFSTSGQNIAGGWEKRKGGETHPLLDKTGRLKKSFKRIKLTNTELEISSKVNYFKFHQLGTYKMPQRQILGFSKKMEKHIIDLFNKFLKTLTK